MNNEENKKEETTTTAEAPKAEETKTPETPAQEPKKTGWFKRVFWGKAAKITYGVLGLGVLGAGAAFLYTREAAAAPDTTEA